jgi:hypothetical protein
MILNNSLNAGNFIYCMAHWTPNESNSYYNTGNGHYHQAVYVIDGEGVAELRETPEGPVIRKEDANAVGQLIDLSDAKGLYHTTTTKDKSLTMIMFNPIPETRELNIGIVKGGTTRTITAGENRIVIVCITGPITANDKTLVSLQHAKIFPGKTFELILPENTVCALVSE